VESSISHSPHALSTPFDLRGELLRLKILAEALTACVSDDQDLRYQYLHQLLIIPKKQRNMLVRFSAIPRGNYEKEFEGFADAMKYLVLSIEHIEACLPKEEEA